MLLKRDVVTVAQLTRLEPDDPPRELRAVSVNLHRVVKAAHGEELRGAAVELRAKYLQRRDDIDLRIAALLDCIHGGVPRDRRVIAVMAGKVREQRLHAAAVMIKPDLFAAQLGAVGRDRIMEIGFAKREKRLVVLGVEREARAIDELF